MAGRPSPSEAETSRQVGELLRWGVIESVDPAAARCIVRVGELLTGPVPWFSRSTGEWRFWSPPSAGEQVLLFCPDGELEAGVVLTGVYSDALPAPRDDKVLYLETPDGSVLLYDPEAKTFSATLAAGVKAHLVAPGGLRIEGPVEIIGDVQLEGGLKASKDVKAGPVSLQQHRHLGVASGPAQTLPPVGAPPA